MRWVSWWHWWLIFASWREAEGDCGLTQFQCTTGNECIRVDKFCDGKSDCRDSSDEPLRCSPCNRTYYGVTGVTYELAPRLNRLPFLCHLTFTAEGRDYGDIVQLTFVEFSVGRYEPAALDGCPDGYMQLAELGRPFTGGSWCGVARSQAIYYSETATVTASVRLFRLPPPPLQLPPQQEKDGFKFILRYRMVSARQAPVRFGTEYAPVERGAVAPGTYCTRTYEECYRKTCRLQSPNYPGMYPRNVTCYWSVRQKDIPTCKHAMIAVRQEAPHKMHVKRSIPPVIGSWNRTGLRAWRECTGERDHLIFYDGGSTNDPVLAVYCGGEWLPRVVSRGPEMLVAFHSSPYSAPLHADPARPTPLRGFQLDVDIIFTDSDSLDYVREASRCEFHIKAGSQEEVLLSESRGRRGTLRAPLHSLPPRTLCSWTFHGRPGDIVWIYFISYTHYSLISGREEESSKKPSAPPPAPPPCLTSLTVWDGGGEGAGSPLLGRACEGEWPRICEVGVKGAVRACTAAESYQSTGPQLALGWRIPEGTALHPATFHIRYEFADTRLGGILYKPPSKVKDPFIQPADCSRLYRHLPAGTIISSRNVMAFGRGGGVWMRCVYRVEAREGERLHLVLDGSSWGLPGAGTGATTCRTDRDPHTGYPRCLSRHHTPIAFEEDTLPDSAHLENRIADLRVYESPWPDVKVPVACICAENTSVSDWRWMSGSHAFELRYTISAFNVSEDYRHFNFRVNYTTEPATSLGLSCTATRRLRPPGEMLVLNYPSTTADERSCGETPYFLQARSNHSVFLMTWGRAIPVDHSEIGTETADNIQMCHTSNRLLIYSYRPTRLLRIVCPSEPYAPHAALHVYSIEWGGRSGSIRNDNKMSEGWGGGALSVKPVWREAGAMGFTWLEVEAARTALLRVATRALIAGGAAPVQAQRLQETLANVSYWGGDDSECVRLCPELEACVSAALWCDGVPHCPSGWDESEAQCGLGARLLARLGGWSGASRTLGAVAAALVVSLIVIVAAAAARRRYAAWSKRGPALPPHAPLLYEVSTVSSTASS